MLPPHQTPMNIKWDHPSRNKSRNVCFTTNTNKSTWMFPAITSPWIGDFPADTGHAGHPEPRGTDHAISLVCRQNLSISAPHPFCKCGPDLDEINERSRRATAVSCRKFETWHLCFGHNLTPKILGFVRNDNLPICGLVLRICPCLKICFKNWGSICNSWTKCDKLMPSRLIQL